MILGTAGHVDHGKTTLVKALTGIDTDRLPEEKRRGITLELGFAHLTLPSGKTVGVVDVPGHERFVKAMAAGAGGIDVALLVVAADEGVMPQTREHVDILSLLGVRKGLVVLTKADLLPELGAEWRELVEADARALLLGTPLEGAPLLPVSARSGEGLPGLLAALDALAKSFPERGADGPLFLPVDRAFTAKGFGCVVTGTLLSGRLALEEEVSLLPLLPGPFRVRGLQVHGKPVEKAQAGTRVAVNVAGVETEAVSRGLVLTRAHELSPTRSLDVELTLLPSVESPLPRRSRRLVTLGTAQVEAVVRLLDVDALRPGETCFAQLRLAAPLAAMPQQRFIVRGSTMSAGRGATVAGGRVLALDTPRRRAGAAERLARLAQADLDTRLLWLLAEAGYAGLEETELFARASAPPKELARALETLAAKGKLVLVDKEARRFLSKEVLSALEARALARLEAFHAASPELDGLSKEELKQRLGVPSERTFQRVLTALADAKRVEATLDRVRLPGRGRAFTEAAEKARAALKHALHSSGLSPPTLSELALLVKAPEARVAELLGALVAEGAAVKASELWFDAQAVLALQQKLVAHLAAHGGISTQEFKELVGQTRKYVIPLAEYFDTIKVTLRVGDRRVPRKRPEG